jgi:AcrR family transcriptional regulator
MTQQVSTGNRLQQIRSVAIDHFSRKGYHGANLREIAADVGIQAGSMYYHFDSKEQLLFDALSVSMEEMTRQARESVDWQAPPSIRLHQLVQFHIRYHADHQAEARVTHNEFDILTGRYREELWSRRDAYERMFEEILQEGVDRGEFRSMDVRLAVFAILAIGQGVSRWYRPDGRLTANQIAGYYADMVLRAATATERETAVA